MTFRIRTTRPDRVHPENKIARFIAIGRSGAIILVSDPQQAKTWISEEGAMPIYQRCKRTCVAPNTLEIEPVSVDD
jgi:hypothetical protein